MYIILKSFILEKKQVNRIILYKSL